MACEYSSGLGSNALWRLGARSPNGLRSQKFDSFIPGNESGCTREVLSLVDTRIGLILRSVDSRSRDETAGVIRGTEIELDFRSPRRKSVDTS